MSQPRVKHAPEMCANCERAFRPSELRAQADAEAKAFSRRYNGLFAALSLMLLAALAFVVLRGT
jgi:hypothetical protein